MDNSRFDIRSHQWIHAGMIGALANLFISGSGLSAFLWIISSATFSERAISIVPGELLVYVVPIFLIGFAAGSAASLFHFGKSMEIFAALVGSIIGFLAGALALDVLSTDQDEFPIIKYAGWNALTVTAVGILLAIGIIALIWSIRKMLNRYG